MKPIMRLLPLALPLTLLACESNNVPTYSDNPPGSEPGTVGVIVSIPQGAMELGVQAYGINPLLISAGSQVTWINGDNTPHTVTSDAGVFDSSTLGPGQSFTFLFPQTGSYPYHCKFHSGMHGSVVVTVQSGATPSAFPQPTPLPAPSPIPTPSTLPVVPGPFPQTFPWING